MQCFPRVFCTLSVIVCSFIQQCSNIVSEPSVSIGVAVSDPSLLDDSSGPVGDPVDSSASIVTRSTPARASVNLPPIASAAVGGVPVEVPSLRYLAVTGCQSGFVSPGAPLENVRLLHQRTVRSELDCAVLCSGDSRCGAYNFVKSAAAPVNRALGVKVNLDLDLERWTPSCQLLDTMKSAVTCEDLVSHPYGSFKYAQRAECALQTVVTDSGWTLTYATDAQGQPCHGSLETLKDSLMAGRRVAVLVPGFSGEPSSAAPVASLGVAEELEIEAEGHVCASLPFTVVPEAWDQINGTDPWKFRTVCTTGSVLDWTGQEDAAATEVKVRHTQWYTDSTVRDVVLDRTRERQQGSVQMLASSLATGEDHLLMTVDTSTNETHVYPGAAFVATEDSGRSQIDAVHVWNLEQRNTSSLEDLDKFIQLTWFSSRAASNRRYAWSLTSRESDISQQRTRHRVLKDTRWALVYTSTGSSSSFLSSSSSESESLEEVMGGEEATERVNKTDENNGDEDSGKSKDDSNITETSAPEKNSQTSDDDDKSSKDKKSKAIGFEIEGKGDDNRSSKDKKSKVNDSKVDEEEEDDKSSKDMKSSKVDDSDVDEEDKEDDNRGSKDKKSKANDSEVDEEDEEDDKKSSKVNGSHVDEEEEDDKSSKDKKSSGVNDSDVDEEEEDDKRSKDKKSSKVNDSDVDEEGEDDKSSNNKKLSKVNDSDVDEEEEDDKNSKDKKSSKVNDSDVDEEEEGDDKSSKDKKLSKVNDSDVDEEEEDDKNSKDKKSSKVNDSEVEEEEEDDKSSKDKTSSKDNDSDVDEQEKDDNSGKDKKSSKVNDSEVDEEEEDDQSSKDKKSSKGNDSEVDEEEDHDKSSKDKKSKANDSDVDEEEEEDDKSSKDKKSSKVNGSDVDEEEKDDNSSKDKKSSKANGSDVVDEEEEDDKSSKDKKSKANDSEVDEEEEDDKSSKDKISSKVTDSDVDEKEKGDNSSKDKKSSKVNGSDVDEEEEDDKSSKDKKSSKVNDSDVDEEEEDDKSSKDKNSKANDSKVEEEEGDDKSSKDKKSSKANESEIDDEEKDNEKSSKDKNSLNINDSEEGEDGDKSSEDKKSKENDSEVSEGEDDDDVKSSKDNKSTPNGSDIDEEEEDKVEHLRKRRETLDNRLSLDDLIANIRGGHRVRLAVRQGGTTQYFLADHLVITPDDLVVAQVLSADEDGAKNGYLTWHLIHSDGNWHQYQARLPSLQISRKIHRQVEVSWFVDTDPYRVIMETAQGGVTSGSAADLRASAVALHDMRLRIQQGENDNFFAVDQLLLGPKPEEGVSAVNMRSMKTLTDESLGLGEAAVAEDPPEFLRGVASMVTSSGTVSTRDWSFKDISSNLESRDANVTWFIKQ